MSDNPFLVDFYLLQEVYFAEDSLILLGCSGRRGLLSFQCFVFRRLCLEGRLLRLGFFPKLLDVLRGNPRFYDFAFKGLDEHSLLAHGFLVMRFLLLVLLDPVLQILDFPQKLLYPVAS